MKPKHQRLLFLLASMLVFCVGGMFVLSSFRDNLVFFYSPSDIAQKRPESSKLIRVGGLVQTGSIKYLDSGGVRFVITDGNSDITIFYEGILPNLFREKQGCIAEGNISDSGEFYAKKVLAKHDEKYMPKEVVDSLKKSGNWHGGEPSGDAK